MLYHSSQSVSQSMTHFSTYTYYIKQLVRQTMTHHSTYAALLQPVSQTMSSPSLWKSTPHKQIKQHWDSRVIMFGHSYIIFMKFVLNVYKSCLHHLILVSLWFPISLLQSLWGSKDMTVFVCCKFLLWGAYKGVYTCMWCNVALHCNSAAVLCFAALQAWNSDQAVHHQPQRSQCHWVVRHPGPCHQRLDRWIAVQHLPWDQQAHRQEWTQVHCLWWRCWCPLGGEHELCHGWQPPADSGQRRAHPSAETLCYVVWGACLCLFTVAL